MEIKTITRTSAIVYADGMSQRKTNTIRRKFVEATLVQKGNTPLTIQEIGVALQENLGLHFSDNDLSEIVSKDSSFVEQKARPDDNTKYLLEEKRYRILVKKSEHNIENVIDRYLETNQYKLKVSSRQLKKYLESYLYALLNSNIEAYSQVLNPTSTKNNGRVVPNDFDEDQIRYINDFISWHDDEKDKELYKLVSYCVEYAIVVNDSNENTLIESLRSKNFYLDNSLIYRAIGINGEVRRKRTLSFINKCRENGQQLYVSKFSREEFLDTIDYHLKQLNKTTPYGKINPHVFQRYANGEGFYQFYHEWREKKVAYGFELFKSHIISEYKTLLMTYGIKEDFSVPFDEKNSKEVELYEEQIRKIKSKGHESLHHNDASNMYWIECKRAGHDARITDTQYYFITSDQKLQKWDYSHSQNQPITLLPSQWMALLLKYVSRTNDDYNSFVSFLKLPHNEPVIQPDELQVVMAGISEITENFKNQTNIVDILFESDWRTILKDAPRIAAKDFAKDKLEDQLVAQLVEKDKQHQSSIDEISKSFDDKLANFRKEAEKMLLEQEQQFREDKLKEVERQLRDLGIMKHHADEAIEKQLNSLKRKFAILIFLLLCPYVAVVFWLGWNKMKIYTWLIMTVLALVSLFYLILFEKSFSLERTLKKYREKYTMHYYSLFMYSKERYDDLLDTQKELKSDIGSITTQTICESQTPN